MERIPRLTLINSITGYKPANLIGTSSNTGIHNLAIFSSVLHLGSAPPLIGMVSRPTVVERDTYRNILEKRFYTINHVHHDQVAQAHQTSASYPSEVSEFEACGFTPWWSENFPVPFVAESPLKIGLSFQEEIPIKANGTILIIGQVEEVHLPQEAMDEAGNLDFSCLGTACITGLDTYHKAEPIDRFPYARVKPKD